MRRPLTGIALSLGLAMAAADASGQTFTIQTSGGAGWRNTSGVATSSHQDIMAPANQVLVAIEFGERADVPCYIRPLFWSGSGGSGSEVFRMCDGQQGDLLRAQLPGYAQYGRAVDGLRICTRSQNGRLKGITLYGATLGPNGADRDPGITDPKDRARCNDQQDRVNCPRGQVVTGLRIWYDNSTGLGRTPSRKQVEGLMPFCSRVSAASNGAGRRPDSGR